MSHCSPFTALLILTLQMTLCPVALSAEKLTSASAHTSSGSALWNDYFSWRELGDNDKALAAAFALRDHSANSHGTASPEYGMALAEVGISRLLAEDHDAAFVDLRAAEVLLKEQLPIYSEKLIRALTFLGSALQSRGRFEEALDAYTRAQHITHRLWGTDNDTQIPITYAKAATLQALGEVNRADQQYGLAWKLNRVHFGVASPQAIAAAARYGTWLRAIGQYDAAISVFHDALSEVHGGGPDQPVSLPLLRGMAHAYRGGHRGKHARGMYQRIIEMMEQQPEAFSVDQRVEVRLAFGDWLMQRYFERPAVSQYEAAWAIANNAGPDGAHWLSQFAEPQLVRYGEMSPRDLSGQGRQVTFQFRMTNDGRIKRAKVSETNAGSRDTSRARKDFPALTRFRPMIVDGQAQEHAAMTTTMYLLPDGMAIEPAPIAAPERLTIGPAAGVANWTLLRQDQVVGAEIATRD